jgi:tripartite-type tricarboxylate transporter receptor subunit TctC
MSMIRRRARGFAAALAMLFAFAASHAVAQSFPSKPIRIVVPYTAGGGTDVMARIVAERLTESLGQPVLVENRPGAGGIIGLESVFKSEHDGYTLVMMPSNLSILGPLYGKLPFDPLKDFAPIALVGSSPVMIGAHPSFPANTFQEFIAYAKANPNKVDYGSCGTASPQHIAGEYLNAVAGITLTHVPYKGCSQALVDVLSGAVPLFFATVAHVNPQAKAGKMKALATTGPTRTPLAPDVPTVAESGYPGYNVDVWFGLLAPGRTPPEVVQRLNAEVNKALERPEVREKMAQQFYAPAGGTSAKFAETIRADLERFSKPIQQAGIKPQ